MLRVTTACLLTLALSTATTARAAEFTETARGPNRAITNIVFSGLAGAILGLSTLSFYGRPQDKLNNIGLGFAVGIIGGTIYTTYRAASEPREFYGLRDAPEPWALADDPRFTRATSFRLVNYQFEF